MSGREFAQVAWDEILDDDCRQLVRLAVREDLDRMQDWTTLALIPMGLEGRATVVARQEGVLAGLRAAETVLGEMHAQVQWLPESQDGDRVTVGDRVAELVGSVRDILVAERPLLNFVGRLSAIATRTRMFVEAITGTNARIYDTRKTTPGWRRLEKYAVRCGGGFNHRTGLFDAVLIKDNHLAFAGLKQQPSLAVNRARDFLREASSSFAHLDELLIEVEVESLSQLADALTATPDIVLLDNMSVTELAQAVALRNQAQSRTELEASGGVTLETLRGIAETGVERISAGAITHSATNFDVALDWSE